MPHPLRRRAHTGGVVLAAAKAALLASIVVAGWTDAATTPGGAVAPLVERHARDAVLAGDPAARPGRRVERALDVHRCSVTGFADGRTPRSALVRSPTGRLRHVSFDTGWRVYTAHGPATLVAVCLDRAPAGHLDG